MDVRVLAVYTQPSGREVLHTRPATQFPTDREEACGHMRLTNVRVVAVPPIGRAPLKAFLISMDVVAAYGAQRSVAMLLI